jgi:hypothetical protein
LFEVGDRPAIRLILEKEIGRQFGRPRKNGVPDEK